MFNYKVPFRGFILLLGLLIAIPAFSEIPFSEIEKCEIRGSVSDAMTKNEENGVYEYTYSGTGQPFYLKILVYQSMFFGGQGESNDNGFVPNVALPVGEEYEAASSSQSGGVGSLFFNTVKGGEYKITFNGTYITLTATEPNYTLSGSIADEPIENAGFTVNGINFEYSISDAEGPVRVKIYESSKGVYFGGQSEADTELTEGEPVALSQSTDESGCGYLTFNAIKANSYKLSFDGANLSLSISSKAYRIVGSYKGSTETVSIGMEMPDKNQSLYEYTFKGVEGILFFMVCEVTSQDQPNMFFGAPYDEETQRGINTPLNGTYASTSNIDRNLVGSLFFEMKPDREYKITFDGTNIILSITETVQSAIGITASSNTPGFKLFLTDIADEKGPDTPVTRVEITSWDSDLIKRRGQLFSYQSGDDDANITLSNLNALFNGLTTDNEGFYADPTTYTEDGEYLYRIIYYLSEQGHDGSTVERRYTVYSNPFTISKDGNNLILNAFYLVQVGDGSSNYLTIKDGDNPYTFNVTHSFNDLGHKNQITFERSSYDDDDEINFGDETIFKFTDQVLIRSNRPFNGDISNIKYCKLFIEEYDEDGKIIAKTKKEVPNIQDNSNVLSQDGRFMAIIDLHNFIDFDDQTVENPIQHPLGNLKYTLEMHCTIDNEDVVLSASTELSVTIPTPTIEKTYYSFSNSKTPSGVYPQNFKYTSPNNTGKTFDLNGARVHMIKCSVESNKPNLTNYLGKLMQSNLTGHFYYQIDYSHSRNEASPSVVTFNVNSLDNSGSYWSSTSKALRPSKVISIEDGGDYDNRVISLGNDYLAHSYKRWNELDIPEIQITDEAPNSDNDKPASLTYWEYNAYGSNVIYENFKITVKIVSDYVNKIKDGDNVYELSHEINDESSKVNNDYFYLTIQHPETGAIEFETVVNANDLSNGITSKIISHRHDTGNVEAVKYDYPYFKELEVHLSYLYPFLYEEEKAADEPMALSLDLDRDSNTDGEVLRSQEAVFPLSNLHLSSIVDLESEESVRVHSGEGFIEINGGNADIYNVSGVKVAQGEGRHLLSPGVYIVSNYEKRIKVTVK